MTDTHAGPSRSAMLVAACRMLADERPEADRLIHDPLARLFVDERSIAAARADEHLQHVIRLRTRYIDDAVVAFDAEHVDAQVLLLGAGLDARAFRMDIAARFFEVDFPATLAYKQAAIDDAGISAPGGRVIVPVDLATECVSEPLVTAGFDRRRAAIVVWEGVINYLDNDTAEAVLAQLADLLAPGSVLVADYVEDSWFRDDFVRSTKQIAGQLREGGEPLRSGLLDAGRSLAATGFEVVDDEAVELLPTRCGLAVHDRHYPARMFTARRTAEPVERST